MPKTHRELVRRQIAHAHNNIDVARCAIEANEPTGIDIAINNVKLAASHLYQPCNEFGSTHPELGDQLDTVVVGLTLIQGHLEKRVPMFLAPCVNMLADLNKVLERFCMVVWNRETIDWDSWRNVPVK